MLDNRTGPAEPREPEDKTEGMINRNSFGEEKAS